MNACLTEQDLRLYVNGLATDEQISAWNEHIDTCPACTDRLAEASSIPADSDATVTDSLLVAFGSGFDWGILNEDALVVPVSRKVRVDHSTIEAGFTVEVDTAFETFLAVSALKGTLPAGLGVFKCFSSWSASPKPLNASCAEIP